MDFFAEYLSEIISGVSSATLALATAFFVGKRWVLNQFNKSFAKYQSELDAKTEILKNQLSIYAHEQNVGLSRIDTQRAQSIADIYAAIANWGIIHNKLHWTMVFQSSEDASNFYMDQRVKLHQAYDNIAMEMVKGALYLSSNAYDNVSKLLAKIAEYSSKIDVMIRVELAHGAGKENFVQIRSRLQGLKREYVSEVDPIRAGVIQEFRSILKAQ